MTRQDINLTYIKSIKTIYNNSQATINLEIQQSPTLCRRGTMDKQIDKSLFLLRKCKEYCVMFQGHAIYF